MGMRHTIRKMARKIGVDVVPLRCDGHRVVPECFRPGHYYSVIPPFQAAAEKIPPGTFTAAGISGIELNIQSQLSLLQDFRSMREPVPFYSRARRIRFDIENNSFSYDDAPILNCMMRRLRPKRVIEIGSGYSSACMLDTNDMYLGRSVDFTFIDANCRNLRRFLLEKDRVKVRILEHPVQDVDPSLFSGLRANDLLFIDSSHVIKRGSDLQAIFFEVLPRLAPGVWIHFHDIRYPFRYPESYASQGVFWNEAYLLRAFLMFNRNFDIAFWLNLLINFDLPQAADLPDLFPLAEWDRRFNNGTGVFSEAGGSIYIVKTR